MAQQCVCVQCRQLAFTPSPPPLSRTLIPVRHLCLIARLLLLLGCRDEYFKDNRTLEQIDKDVRRLNPEFAFYQMMTGVDRRKILGYIFARFLHFFLSVPLWQSLFGGFTSRW